MTVSIVVAGVGVKGERRNKMEFDRITISKLLANPKLLKECSPSFLFYDWFCSDASLERRAKVFIPKLKFLVSEGLLDGDKHYVWFKNNCPLNGILYDDMRISTIPTGDKPYGDYVGGFCPRLGYANTTDKCQIWFIKEDNKVDTREYLNWTTFKKEVKTNEELRIKLKQTYL